MFSSAVMKAVKIPQHYFLEYLGQALKILCSLDGCSSLQYCHRTGYWMRFACMVFFATLSAGSSFSGGRLPFSLQPYLVDPIYYAAYASSCTRFGHMIKELLWRHHPRRHGIDVQTHCQRRCLALLKLPREISF